MESNYYKTYLYSYPKIELHTAAAPYFWDKRDWMLAGCIVALDTGLYLLDESIDSAVQKHKSTITEKVARFGNNVGDAKYMLPALSIACVIGNVCHSDKLESVSLKSAQSIIVASTVAHILKISTQRPRPYDNKGNQFWQESEMSLENNSFPSGHTVVTWSVATVFAKQYKDTVWVPCLAYGTALSTAFARVHDHKHWASDVLASAAIGYFTSSMIMDSKPLLTVSAVEDTPTLNIVYRF